MARKLISVVTPCFNEEKNIRTVYERVRSVFKDLPAYEYEHIFIDNASKDNTVAILREVARQDRNVRVIVNARNFGHIRSPHHAILMARGDAIIILVSDLQDPPEMIKEFIKKWEEGFRIVIGVRERTEESKFFFLVRKAYYRLVKRLADLDLVENFTGFGLYDRTFIEIIRRIDDPYPYFRGLVCEIGFERAEIPYQQMRRRRGVTSNNFYTLYDMAMLGITNHSKVPLRLATMIGFGLAIMSLIVAFGYFVYKLIFWDSFSVGIAPLVIGLFFFSSVQLFFIGIIGEYIGAIHTQTLKRPLVTEKERINFD